MSGKHVKNVADITLLVCDKPHVKIYANHFYIPTKIRHKLSDKCVSDGASVCVCVCECNLNLCDVHKCTYCYTVCTV